MVYNLDFLKEGGVYPLRSEIKRFKQYNDGRVLFDGDTELIYKRRFDRVRDALRMYEGKSDDDLATYKTDINYHKLITLKTADLVVGEQPTIAVDENRVEDMEEIKEHINFNEKSQQIVMDMSSLADCIVQIYKDNNGKGNFVIKDPTMWTPIIDQETNEITQHLIVWFEDLTPELKENYKRFKMHVQIHEKGYYLKREYEIKGWQWEDITGDNNEWLGRHRIYKIGRMLEEKKVDTMLDDFAIIHFPNITTSKNIYGISDYENLTPIIAELEIRLAIEQLILDKHGHPTPYYPESAFYEKHDAKGNSLGWFPKTGTGFILGENEVPPGYMEFSGQLNANHEIISRLKKELYSLSEMGAVINDEAFGASQGYEALETRMVNARMKARRLASKLDKKFKKLLSLVSNIGGHSKFDIKDISIFFNDGIPDNEFRNTDIVQRRLQSGTISRSTALVQYHGYNREQADEEIQRVNDEKSDGTMATLGLQRSNI